MVTKVCLGRTPRLHTICLNSQPGASSRRDESKCHQVLFFLIKMNKRPPPDVDGYLITLRQDPFSLGKSSHFPCFPLKIPDKANQSWIGPWRARDPSCTPKLDRTLDCAPRTKDQGPRTKNQNNQSVGRQSVVCQKCSKILKTLSQGSQKVLKVK